jgi:hypothetical protein
MAPALRHVVLGGPLARAWDARGANAPVTAASSDRAWGRHTCEGNDDRSPGGAARSARVRSCRSGKARTWSRVRRATRWLRRARYRPLPPIREQTWLGWRPTGRLPLRIRTWRPPHEVADSDTPGNASHFRRRARSRLPRQQLQLGAGPGVDRGRGWLCPGTPRQRLSPRRGVPRQPRGVHLGAHCEGVRSLMRATGTRASAGTRAPGETRAPSKKRTTASDSRGKRRWPRRRPAGRRQGSWESDGSFFVLVRGRSSVQSRDRGVAGTYRDFDMPAICASEVASELACVDR